MDAYEHLANAIILQAVRDWQRAMMRLRKRSTNPDAESIRLETERFFLSSWFGALTTMDGKELLRKLKEDLAK